MAINFPSSPTTGDSYTYLNSIYQWDGTHWSKIGGVTGQVLATQVFTASGTYTPTTGMEYCIIECVGSGAGGGGSASATNQGIAGGGGGGSYARKLASATTIGASQTVTVGNAGTGGTAGPNNGTNGSDVSVGTICIGKGGSAGQGVPSDNAGTGGAGGVAGTGDFTMVGGNGWNGQLATVTTVNLQGGSGGASGFGYGAATGTVGFTNAGLAGKLYGGGGGGASARAAGGAVAGGDGAKGIVTITEFSRSSPVPGVASSTDNAIVRFDGTTGRAQNSGVAISDANQISWNTPTDSITMLGGAAVTVAGTNGIKMTFGNGAFDGLQLNSSAAGTQGPTIYSFHDSASPAGGDVLFLLDIYGRDDATNAQEYGYLRMVLVDPTSTSEDSKWQLVTYNAGAASTMEFIPGGITFPAAQLASAGANVLDDYEEGTWTPTMTFNASSSGVTYGTQAGNYTKVGNVVNIRGIVALTNNGSGVGTALITGGPFTIAQNTPLNGHMFVGGSAATGIYAHASAATTTFDMVIPGATGRTLATDTNCTDTFNFAFGGIYFV